MGLFIKDSPDCGFYPNIVTVFSFAGMLSVMEYVLWCQNVAEAIQ